GGVAKTVISFPVPGFTARPSLSGQQAGWVEAAGVQPALFRVGQLPPPPPGARILAGAYRPGPGRAASRRLPGTLPEVAGNATGADLTPHVGLGPVDQGIELHQPEHRVVLAGGQVGAADGLLATLARDPGRTAGQGLAQRPHLADAAAGFAQAQAFIESELA